MKILKIALVISFFTMISCENWLDVSSTSQLDRNDLFRTENGYGEALTGVYAKLCDKSLYGRTLTFDILDIMASYYPDMNFNHSYWWDYSYANPGDQYAVNYCSPTIEAVWTNLYAQIANLNSLLETIDGNRGVFTGDNYRLIKGEALGLRAYLHFDLLRLFAEAWNTGKDKKSIPYVSELTSLVTPVYTQEKTIERILTDLDSAKILLTEDPMRLGTSPATCLASSPSGSNLSANKIEPWHNRRFRFNYYAAVATMARVYMWKGDRTNALKAALEIISDQETKFPWVLTKNLTNIGNTSSTSYSNQDRSFATEHIFALNVTDLEDCMDGYIFNGKVPANLSSETRLEITTQTRTEVYESISSDLRYQYWFKAFNTNWFISKFYQNSVTARYFQERLPLIRLSEMYYIAAECTPGNGINYLETVRSHRGLSSYSLSPDCDPEEEIRKEYRKEFWGEGQLWYYYKRKSYMDFNSYMTNTEFFTWKIPDTEISNAGRE